MPGIETLLPARLSTKNNLLDGAAQDSSEQPATGDDFDHLMQASMAGQSQRAGLKNLPLAGGALLTALPLPAGILTKAVSEKKSGPAISATKSGDEKKSPTAGDTTPASDPLVAPPAPNTTEPNPALLSLPSFLAVQVPTLPNVTPPVVKSGSADSSSAAGVSVIAGLGDSQPASAATAIATAAKKPSLTATLGMGSSAAAFRPLSASSFLPAPADVKSPTLPATSANSPVDAAKNSTLAKDLAAIATGSTPASKLSELPAGLTALPTTLSAALPTANAPAQTSASSNLNELLPKAEPNTNSQADITTAAPASQPNSAARLDTQASVLNLHSQFSKEAASLVTEARPTNAPEDLATNTATPPENGLDTTLKQTTEATLADAGTGVAFTVSPMKNQQKTNKIAGLDEKVLPVGENGLARVKNLPPQLQVAPVRATQSSGSDLNFSFANGNSHAPTVENTPALNTLDLPSLTDVRMRALDRTHDMMLLHSMRLVESKTDSLSVVLKPAIGTELTLELHLHPEGIQAQATVTRGDFQFLNQHWSDLQQKLEQRGIKLAPLASEADFSANDNQQFRQQQAANEEMAQQASAFAEFASVGATATGGATARVVAIHDGWESWA